MFVKEFQPEAVDSADLLQIMKKEPKLKMCCCLFPLACGVTIALAFYGLVKLLEFIRAS